MRLKTDIFQTENRLNLAVVLILIIVIITSIYFFNMIINDTPKDKDHLKFSEKPLSMNEITTISKKTNPKVSIMIINNRVPTKIDFSKI